MNIILFKSLINHWLMKVVHYFKNVINFTIKIYAIIRIILIIKIFELALFKKVMLKLNDICNKFP